MTWTPDEIERAVMTYAQLLQDRGVPIEELSAALAGIGIRLALSSGIAETAIQSLLDMAFKEHRSRHARSRN